MENNKIEEIPKDIFQTIPPSETVTIIVPLYGYFKENVIPELTSEIKYDELVNGKKVERSIYPLSISLSKIRSFFHKVYYIFVAEQGRVDLNTRNILLGKSMGGNSKGLDIEPYSTYSMYLDEGLKYALEKTDSKYLICINPWIMVTKSTIDQLLERINRIDIEVCSGYNAKKDVSAEDFEDCKFTPIKEFNNLDINLFAFRRSLAERISIDIDYKTKEMFEKDLQQTFHSKNETVISSQIAPYFHFDVDWTPIEGEEEIAQDKARFLNKWKFNSE